jgi:hypothetical protein
MFKQSSPLKLLGQMEPNLAGSIYVRFSIKLLHMVPFGQRGEDFFNISQSEKELYLVAIFVGQMAPNEDAL